MASITVQATDPADWPLPPNADYGTIGIDLEGNIAIKRFDNSIRYFIEKNEDDEIVGPIIGRMLLETDNTTVPSKGEQVAIVDSLTTPTRVEMRTGDGVTVKGVIDRQTPLDVANDTAKLAIPQVSLTTGRRVRLTGEANRIEEYLGGDPSVQTNWEVIKNTIRASFPLTLSPGWTITINGITYTNGSGTNTPGWLDPENITIAYNQVLGAVQLDFTAAVTMAKTVGNVSSAFRQYPLASFPQSFSINAGDIAGGYYLLPRTMFMPRATVVFPIRLQGE